MNGTIEGVLAGRHALVTGGGTGIGAAIARRFSAEGAAVTIVGRRSQPLESLAAELPRACAATGDVTNATDVGRVLDMAHGAFGAIDILVNNAGAAESASFPLVDAESWRRMMSVNLDALFVVTQAVLPELRAASAGRIVNIASTAGVKGYPYTVAYCAAKHGAIGFTRALALELARTPVTVNAVCPGFTDTAIVDDAVARISAKTGRDPAQARRELASHNPQGRLIDPDEVADATLWLCLPTSRSITGQAIMVAGGEVN